MAEQEAGYCRVCHRGPFVLLSTGVVKAHGPRKERCEGSLEEPGEPPNPADGPGWCPVCRRGPFAIVLSGVLRTHGPLVKRCEGSLTDPASGAQPGRAPRSLQVLALAAEGLPNALIGQRLYITEDTVKTHLRRTFRALGARDRAQAVHIACHRGLLPCRDEAVS